MGRLRNAVPRSRVPWHRRVLRDPAAVRYWLLVGAVALVLATVVGRSLDRAESTRRGWGRTRLVLIAARPIRTDEPLAGAVRRERWPTGLVPPAALTALRPDARAVGPLDPGTPITSASLADQHRADHRTVAVALPDAHLPVEPGDVVDVWATTDPSLVADGEQATRRVAVRVRVEAVRDASVVLVVAPAQVAALADAASTATISLVGTR